MARTVQLGISDVSFYVSISIEQHDTGGSDTYFSIKKGEADIVFRLEELEPLRAALREAENVLPNLEMTLRAATATATNAEQPDPTPDEAEIALTSEAMSLLRGMGLGYRVHDNVEGGRCRFANAVATMPEAFLEELQNRRLVQILEQDELNSRCVWGISVEGSALLAAQESEDSAWSDRPRTGDDD